ncbi:MAG: maleylpyruvate isomerase N-terminal domain-containing protein, partial [Actinomycetota bacterium]
METAEYLAELRRQGDLLGAAAERTDLDTPIPTCPEWRMRDLVQHMGDVHRWAAAHVAE